MNDKHQRDDDTVRAFVTNVTQEFERIGEAIRRSLEVKGIDPDTSLDEETQRRFDDIAANLNDMFASVRVVTFEDAELLVSFVELQHRSLVEEIAAGKDRFRQQPHRQSTTR